MNEQNISWNANQPFYEHMRDSVWNVLTVSDQKVNELNGADKLNALENQYSAVMHWRDMVIFYMSDDDKTRLLGLFDIIEKKTMGAEFSQLYDAQVNKEIRQTLQKIRTELWLITARNGMLPVKKEYSPATAWQE